MKIVKSMVVALSVVSSSLTFAFDGDLEKGIFELNRGEFKAAIKEFQPLVEEGYAPAQYQMALIYLNGYGVIKNSQQAFELIEKSANQNYPDALFSLANMYTDGDLVKKDPKMAFKLMAKAADKNLPSAQFNLGVMYANGEGTPKDYRRAANWYEKAARQNYALAQFNLALMYFEGKGVKKDIEKSYIWNTIAAKSGYAPAVQSRDMDERNLGNRQIEEYRAKAETLYAQIQEQVDLKTKQILSESF